MPIIPFTPKNLINKEKEIDKNKEINNGEKKENKSEENKNKDKVMPTVFVPTPIFINQMNKTQKNIYNKFQVRKMRPFTERTGDWICKNCKNLNFAFRIECNRCKLPKKDLMESLNTKDYKKFNENNYIKNDLSLNLCISNNKCNNFYRNSYQNKNKCKYKNQLQNEKQIFNLNNNKDLSNNNADN